MRRAALGWIVLVGLAACERGSGPSPSASGPSERPAAPAPAPDAADGSPLDAGPPDAGQPPPTEPASESAPYVREGDAATGIDDFAFWGWSEDGRYYAFETFHAGAGMANCEGEAELSIVDAQTDRYADDGHVRLQHADAEAETCDPPDLKQELAYRRAPRLERYGISPEHVGGPLAFEGGPERFRLALPDGGLPITFTLHVLHGSSDPMEAAEGAAYVLRMEQSGMSPVVVELGRRRRPWTLSYGLDQGMAFIGPKGRHAAILVAQRQVMPEGVRTTWMSNGVTLR